MENENTLQDLLVKLEEKQSEYNVLEAIKEKRALTTLEKIKFNLLKKEIEELQHDIEFYKTFNDINFNNSASKLIEQQQQRIKELRNELSRHGNLSNEKWQELANLQNSINHNSILVPPSNEEIDLEKELQKTKDEIAKLEALRGTTTPDDQTKIDELKQQLLYYQAKIQERDLMAILYKPNPTIDEKQALFNNIIETQIKFNEQLTDDLKETLGLEDISPEVLNAKLDELNSSIATLKKYAKGRKVAKEISAMEEQIEAIKYFQENYTDLDALKNNIQEDFRQLYGQKVSEEQKSTLLQSIIQVAETYNCRLCDTLRKKLETSFINLDILKSTLERYQTQLKELENNNENHQFDQTIAELKEKIKKHNDSIDIYTYNYIDIESLKEQFAKLYEQNSSIEEKANFLSNVIDRCNHFNDSLFNDLEKSTELSFDSYDEILTTKENFASTIEELERNNDNGQNDQQIEYLKSQIKKIKNFQAWYIDVDTDKIQYDFLESFNSKTSEAEKEVIRNNIATRLSNDSINFELNNQEDSKKKKKKREKLKKETKRKLKQKDDEVKRSKKPLIIIGAACLATAATITVISQWQNITNFFGFNKNNNDDDKNKYSSSSIAELPEDNLIKNSEATPTIAPTATPVPTPTPNPKVYKLTNTIGYDNSAATNMVKNFDSEELEKILNTKYDNRIELYANESDFLLHNLQDYEDARNKFNLTPSETVDYVNRANLIWATRFFGKEAQTIQIVEMLISISNKDTYLDAHANITESIVATLTQIANNYVFGNITGEDLVKMSAIKFFAKEGTDLHDFLNTFEELSTLSLNGDKNAKDKLFDYLCTFTITLNSYNNEDNVRNLINAKELTSIKLLDIEEYTAIHGQNFVNNAKVNNYFDWFFIVDSFITPLTPTFGTNEKYQHIDELEIIIETALQAPEFDAFCGRSRTLGVN